MISNDLINICKEVSLRYKLDATSFAAFIEVESGGKGFNTDGKIMIQFEQIALFIISDSRLLTALKNKDWHTVASIYNGAGYLALAKRIGREPYNISLGKAYEKYSKIF